jgi:hypothetical protein
MAKNKKSKLGFKKSSPWGPFVNNFILNPIELWEGEPPVKVTVRDRQQNVLLSATIKEKELEIPFLSSPVVDLDNTLCPITITFFGPGDREIQRRRVESFS